MKSSLLLISLVIALANALVALGAADASRVYNGTITYDSRQQQYTFVPNVILQQTGVAYGIFRDDITETGWGVLWIQTNPKFTDNQQMYAAGYLEGVLTAHRINQQYRNINQFFFGTRPPPANLTQFLDAQSQWVESMISANPSSPLWNEIGFVQSQLQGCVDGYNSAVSQKEQLPPFAFQMLNGVGDFLDLLPALDHTRRLNWFEMSTKEARRAVSQQGHCSAFVKVNGDLTDLWAAHSSWFIYGSMNRIYKHYNFQLNSPFIAAKKMSFSSYPGFLESLDDFYIMDSGLSMVQTTNSIFNYSLYDDVTTESLFAWQRVRAANALAKTGKQWAEIVTQYNSGTYNNQYMVVDYKRFKKGVEVQPGTLWVVEQIPGLVEAADCTDQLERGYWSSYNVPYFPKIYQLSGYPDFVRKHGVEFSYQMAPRAQIFRRDAGTVTDLTSLKNLMRYNNYKRDPYSNNDPGNAICSRFDLEEENPGASGCYDSKVTSYALQANMSAEAINGPTTSHGLPPFNWKNFPGVNHFGQPEVFNFDFIPVHAKWDRVFNEKN